MIMQVLSHAGKVMRAVDTIIPEFVGITDTRKHQEFGGAERTCVPRHRGCTSQCQDRFFRDEPLTAIFVTRMITPASLILPLYLMMDELHLTNSLVGIIIGITTLNLPFAIWLLKPFFDALPRDIEEAGLLDGLSPFGVWWRIAVPIAGPGFKTVALFSFIAAWTDLMIPMTISTRPEGWTLPAGVMQMQTRFKIYWGALMSGGLYLTLPTFLIALFAQKYLAQGVKGIALTNN